jgi:hypothetical protein
MPLDLLDLQLAEADGELLSLHYLMSQSLMLNF